MAQHIARISLLTNDSGAAAISLSRGNVTDFGLPKIFDPGSAQTRKCPPYEGGHSIFWRDITRRGPRITCQRVRSDYFGGAGVKISRRAGSGFGLGFGAFLASFLPLSLLPMTESMTQNAVPRKAQTATGTLPCQSGSRRFRDRETSYFFSSFFSSGAAACLVR